eukprot:jgi/Astpho2/9747/Aster-x1605
MRSHWREGSAPTTVGAPYKTLCLEGHTPGRSKALLVSYRGTPYLFGGLAHTAFEGRSPLNPDAFTYATGEAAFMRFRMQSQTWEAACPDAAIPQGRMRLQTGAAAAVLQDQLWLLGNFRAPNEEPPANLPARSPSSVATMWTFDFEDAVWAHVPQQGAPPLRNQAMLAPWVDSGGEGHLLLFGGTTSNYTDVPERDALWMFTTHNSVWRRCETTGTAPFPRGCISLAVWESKAYVIANSKDGAMATFRLDLQTWEWALLRQQRPSPSARRSTVAAASPQGIWALFGGVSRTKAQNDLWIFDFRTEQWSEVTLQGAHALPRYFHMACFTEAASLLVAGGLHWNPASADDRIRRVDQTQVITCRPAVRLHDLLAAPLAGRVPAPLQAAAAATPDCGAEDNPWMAVSTDPIACVQQPGVLTQMLRQQLFCDLHIVVPGGARLGAHRAVLTAASPVFACMLSSSMLEGRESCIHIDDLDAETVELMLQYIYGALPHQLSVWSTVLLYLAADKYQLGSLLFQCREALALTVSLENCFDLARLADAHTDGELEQACAAFLAQHAGGPSSSLGHQQGTSSACQQNVMARYQSMLLKQDQESQDAECIWMTRLAASAKLQAVLVPEALLNDS